MILSMVLVGEVSTFIQIIEFKQIIAMTSFLSFIFLSVLQSCLSQVDKRVVNSTVSDLSGREAFLWFKECESLLFKQAQKAALLTEWMRLILNKHCSYLLSSTELKAELQPFYKSLQERLQSHESLLRISGKLDLLIATAGDRISAQQAQNTQLQTAALRVFREGEDMAAGGEGEEMMDDESDSGSSLDQDELAELMDADFDPDMFM